MLRELLPQPRLIAVLTSPIALEIPEIEAAAQALGQPLLVLQARDAGEIDATFATMAERQVSGLICGSTLYFQVIADKLVGLAARYRIPTVYFWPEFVAAGGLMSYSVNRAEIGGIIGAYVGRILKGAAPADLAGRAIVALRTSH